MRSSRHPDTPRKLRMKVKSRRTLWDAGAVVEFKIPPGVHVVDESHADYPYIRVVRGAEGKECLCFIKGGTAKELRERLGTTVNVRVSVEEKTYIDDSADVYLNLEVVGDEPTHDWRIYAFARERKQDTVADFECAIGGGLLIFSKEPITIKKIKTAAA